MEVRIVQQVLKANDEFAQMVRERFRAAGVRALNLISAPGSGKTSLIEATIRSLGDSVRIGIIEGDPETTLDAERIARLDVLVVQINTAGGCHLDAHLVYHALGDFDLARLDVLFIENVRNLVCPVEFDLGESGRMALVSVAEGDDKAAKYPQLFRTADLVILNKIDLLPFVDFDAIKLERDLGRLNPELPLLKISCRTGEGMAHWNAWVSQARLRATTS